MLSVVACNSENSGVPSITETIAPLSTDPSNVLPTPRAFIGSTLAIQEGSHYVTNDGKLLIQNKYVFDISSEYCGVGWEINSALIPPVSLFFSPDSKYVLVDIHCIEGINKGFVVRLEPIQSVVLAPGGTDSILGEQVQWSPDSKSIVYFRLSSCCSDAPSILPSGFILYNLQTGSKLFLTDGLEYDEFPLWSPNGHWLVYKLECKLIIMNSMGYNLWEIGNIPNCSSDDLLRWDAAKSNVLKLRYLSKHDGEFLFEIEDKIPPSNDAKLINPNLIQNQP